MVLKKPPSTNDIDIDIDRYKLTRW